MVELAYTADLKSAAERLVGSSPTGGTCEETATTLNYRGCSGFLFCQALTPDQPKRAGFLLSVIPRHALGIIRLEYADIIPMAESIHSKPQ